METEWGISGDKPVRINVYVVVQTHLNKHKRWEYKEIIRGVGDWSELVFELYENYGLFKDELATCTTRKTRYEKLDKIAERLEKTDEPFEFKLADGSDDWYQAYSKTIDFKIDIDGKLG